MRERVQELLGDTIPAEPIWGTFRYNEAINRNIQLLASRTLQIDSTAATISISAGTYDYTVTPAIGELFAVNQVFHQASGQELFPLPWTEFNSQYKQDTSAPSPSGVPRHFTMWEATSSARIRVGPTPNASGTLVLHEKNSPDLPTADGSSITFSEILIQGLQAAVAADLIEMANGEMLSRAKLERSFARTLRGQVEGCIREHNLRKLRLGRRQGAVIRRGNPEFGVIH